MTSAGRRARMAALAFSCGLAGLACTHGEPEPARQPAKVAPAPAPAPALAPARTRASRPTAVPADPPEPVEVAPPLPEPGQMLESSLYALGVAGIRRCPGSDRAAAEVREGNVRIAIGLRVTARVDELFVTARDFTLEHAGVIFGSEHTTAARPDCGPRLPARQLRAGESVRGTVVFELPEAEARAANLVFSPTRWGGAPKLALALPECLDACPEERPRAARKRTRPRVL